MLLQPTAARPHRDVGIVFQQPLLLPWRTVLRNVMMPAEAERPGDGVGLALDVCHTWWDPALEAVIRRARPRMATFHVCGWRVPARGLVPDRAMVGDGAIGIPGIRAMADAAGHGGMIKAEAMSVADWWRQDGEVLRAMKGRFAAC